MTSPPDNLEQLLSQLKNGSVTTEAVKKGVGALVGQFGPKLESYYTTRVERIETRVSGPSEVQNAVEMALLAAGSTLYAAALEPFKILSSDEIRAGVHAIQGGSSYDASGLVESLVAMVPNLSEYVKRAILLVELPQDASLVLSPEARKTYLALRAGGLAVTNLQYDSARKSRTEQPDAEIVERYPPGPLDRRRG